MHCPFCGSDSDVRPFRQVSGLHFTYYITCDICGTKGPAESSIQQSVAKETAIRGWNNRITHDEDLALRTAFKLEQ